MALFFQKEDSFFLADESKIKWYSIKPQISKWEYALFSFAEVSDMYNVWWISI